MLGRTERAASSRCRWLIGWTAPAVIDSSIAGSTLCSQINARSAPDRPSVALAILMRLSRSIRLPRVTIVGSLRLLCVHLPGACQDNAAGDRPDSCCQHPSRAASGYLHSNQDQSRTNCSKRVTLSPTNQYPAGRHPRIGSPTPPGARRMVDIVSSGYNSASTNELDSPPRHRSERRSSRRERD